MAGREAWGHTVKHMGLKMHPVGGSMEHGKQSMREGAMGSSI